MKKLSKELKEEGITLELIERAQRIKFISPVQFQKGDEPVKLMKANDTEYWVVLPDGEFLKDRGKLLKFDQKTCTIARARYLLNFEEVEKKGMIQEEIARLKSLVDDKVKIIIDKIDQLIEWSEYDPNKEEKGMRGVLIAAAKKINGQYNAEQLRKKAFAEEIFTTTSKESLIEAKAKYLEFQAKDEYDQLYISLITDGLPLVASISTSDMKLFTKMFHRDNLEETIEKMKTTSHIEFVATVNIEKLYA